MDDETRAAVKDALVREVVALGALMAILWVMGPGRVLIPAWAARARILLGRTDPHEGQVRQFASEVSRWDHEQSAQADRKPAAGGCGCGGQLPPVGHRRHASGDAARGDQVRVRDDRRRAGHLRARRPRHPHERRAGPRCRGAGGPSVTEAEAQDFYEEDEDPAPLWARLESQ